MDKKIIQKKIFASEGFAYQKETQDSKDTLQKSLYILDEAISSKSLKDSKHNKSKSAVLQLDMTSMDASLENSRLHISGLGDDEIGDITRFHNFDVERAESQDLYSEFNECLKKYPSDHQVFELIHSFCVVSHDLASNLQAVQSRPHRYKFGFSQNAMNILENGYMTWTLIYSLFKDRYDAELPKSPESENMPLNVYRSEKDVVGNLYLRDAGVREAQIIVDWCEHTERDRLLENSNYWVNEKAVTWENTLHNLKRKDTGLSYDKKIVTQMDPDAPRRLSQQLHDLDQDDDNKLLHYLFYCVRTGQLDKAQDACVKSGQFWRAASLEGWRLHQDPNHNTAEVGSVLTGVEGNIYRDVWNKCCWKMIQDPHVNIYEKALYGSKCGHLNSMIVVSQTWHDYLWAYFQTFIHQQVEQEIHMNYTGSRALEDIHTFGPDSDLSPQKIFKEMEASATEAVKSEARQWFNVIQKHIILMDIDGLIEEFSGWVQSSYDLPNQLLSFVVHLVLVLRKIGFRNKDDRSDVVLEAYVKFLINDRYIDLVATYTSFLPEGKSIFWYAQFLKGIEEVEERKRCLNLAKQVGLNVDEITKVVVENIRLEDPGITQMGLDPTQDVPQTEDDHRKISSIEWLTFDPLQRSEAMIQANALMRSFLAQTKIAACRQVMLKLPTDTLAVVRRNWKIQTGSTDLSPDLNRAAHEHLCIRAYLDAIETFNHWFEFYHHHAPVEPEQPAVMSFTDQVAFEHRRKQHEIECERFKQALEQYTKRAQDELYNVLLFPQGWLSDMELGSISDDEHELDRLEQLRQLRHLCIPQVCFLLQRVLHDTGHYSECIKLMNVVASDDHRLYQEFNSEDLQQLFRLVGESSHSLLRASHSLLGTTAL